MTKPTAVFIGYMGANLPLYNIIDPDNITGRNGSTVSARTLQSLDIMVPETPEFQGGK